jgi:radical SAM/Cys-rich protein
MPATLSLLRQDHPLSDPRRQLAILERGGQGAPFLQTLERHGLEPLRSEGISVLQINVGKLCNQTCRHCHVDAGPDRREVMGRETMRACLDLAARARIPTIDITGGAPELNPHFRWLVSGACGTGAHVIDRCNLTVLLTPGQRDLPEFLAEHRVEVVASLPCYLPENTDAQRGEGVYDRSIEALRHLNQVGYGRPGTGLTLTLVYNPVGPTLPPSQAGLEADYRHELSARHGVEFTRLFTITNMPISRFLDDLVRSGHYERYMETLIRAFNPAAVAGVMCRTTLSVGWDGRLFDCDFNQMLELPLASSLPRNIHDLGPDSDLEPLLRRPITTHQHCYGCTAGAGSSCQGGIAL